MIQGLIRYINRKKLHEFFGTDERLLARSSKKIKELQSSLIIKNENDLVKIREKYPTYYQMGGERANTAPKDKLQIAASMEENGKSPEEICKATGWMRGPDHK
ncbi:LPD23 domain-containing protein [uncultured Dialister sp.]|uniref:LPD23 domain-containing protein n=1 Tax=uncultured Dialister sp. TaxID=278064 RepID=UPI0025FF7209|nr:LPD23 domain-containing protein [uncultured Dialister sp.]